jgi:hypothetical protein
MRTFLIILAILAAILGGVALYLMLTTPGEATPVRFPLSSSQRTLLSRVPASADSFALIPTAALLHRKLLANPVTHDAVDHWTAEHDVPSPFLIGGADAAIWRTGKRVSYAIRLDPFRAFLVRLWLMSSTEAVGVWDGSVFVIGDSSDSATSAPFDEALANGLPESDLLVVQRENARGAFPPIGRPAVSAIRVGPREIVLVSRARVETEGASEARPAPPARHPRGALLSVTFSEPPRILGDVERLLGTKLSVLVGNGGSIALYDVDTGTLLPRPNGVIAIPADANTRAAMRDVANVATLVGETRDTGNEILVSFDRESIPLYLKDALAPAPWPANRWSLRLDPERFAPILEKLGDNRGLRLVAPRIHRAARDLRRWTSALQQAESIEATDSVSGGVEELRVRIASK